MGAGKKWTKRELAILRDSIQRHPEKQAVDIAGELQGKLEGRSADAIRSKISKISSKGKKRQKAASKKLSSADKLLEALDALEDAKQMLEEALEEVSGLEVWAQQTLVLRDRLKYKVSKDGQVLDVKPDEEANGESKLTLNQVNSKFGLRSGDLL